MTVPIALPWEVRPRRPEPRRMAQAHGRPFWLENAGEIVIAQSLFDVNLRELFDLLTDGGEVTKHVLIRILEGVEIRGMFAAAVDVGDWPDGGETRKIINDGRIQGAAGDGGDGGGTGSARDGSDGTQGGTALHTRHAVDIENNEIFGGGGGGGGGGGAEANVGTVFASANGGGGGGGRGSNPGSGGAAGDSPFAASADDGQDGTTESAGSGGNGGSDSDDGETVNGGDGGGGGGAGQSGSAGDKGSGTGDFDFGSGGSGGAAGNAVDGDSFVTYDTAGDIRGSQVN